MWSSRNYKIKTDQNSPFKEVNCDDEASPTTTIDSASKAEALSSTMANTLVLFDDQMSDPVNTATKTKEQDMIDLLSMTLSTANTSSSTSQSTTPSYNYYDNYVAPWAQQTLPQPPWQQQQPQYQYSQYSSSYPSPPWESSSSTASYNQFVPHANMIPPAVTTDSAVSTTTPAANSKPFVPSYRLFEDLIDFRTADGGIKSTKDTVSSLSSKKTS